MSEAEDWAVIVRAKNQEIQKWQQQALELSNLVTPLRDEVTRLRLALEQAGDDICSEYCGAGPCHKKCMAVKAALTPQAGKGGGE